MKGERAEESYIILKDGVKYLIFLGLVLVLLISHTETSDIYDMSKAVTDHLNSIGLEMIEKSG